MRRVGVIVTLAGAADGQNDFPLRCDNRLYQCYFFCYSSFRDAAGTAITYARLPAYLTRSPRKIRAALEPSFPPLPPLSKLRFPIMCDPQPCCPCPMVPSPQNVPAVLDCVPKAIADPKTCCVPIITPTPCVPVLPVKKKKCRYIQPPRPQSYAPQRKYLPPATKMEENTIYKRSYLPSEGERSPMIIPPNNLCVGEGKISDRTVNKLSYQGPKAPPPCPIVPCDHKLIGDGPMQDITTQKHDYVPKPIDKACLILPTDNIFSSECPMADKTTNKLSYLPVDPRQVAVSPILPTPNIQPPTGKISGQTVNKLSYQPWEMPEPIDMPWARKPMFEPPKLRMEDNTVQKMSYQPPGEYVECDDDAPDCVECPEGMQPHPPKPCCGPCCCPKAAC